MALDAIDEDLNAGLITREQADAAHAVDTAPARLFCAECIICHKRWRVEYFGVPPEVRVVSAELDHCPNCRPERWC